MENRIHELYLILKKRMSDEEILKIAEVNKVIFTNKLRLQRIDKDQMGISIYFKLYKFLRDDELREFLKQEETSGTNKCVSFKESSVAFKEAIQSGLLSDNSKKNNYAGLFMYMGTWDNRNHFKNIQTREYVN